MSFPNPFTNGASPYLLALEHDVPVQPWEIEMFENTDPASNPTRDFQHQRHLPRTLPQGQGRRNHSALRAPPRSYATARKTTAQNSHSHNFTHPYDFYGPRVLYGRAGPMTVYYGREGPTTRPIYAEPSPQSYMESLRNERQNRIVTTPLNVSRAPPQPQRNDWRQGPVQPYFPVEEDLGLFETEVISNTEVEAANQEPLRTQALTPSHTVAEEQQDNCPFCQDTITDNVFLIPCGHACCRTCLRDFATHLGMNYSPMQRLERYKCPICRGLIVDRGNLLR
ncbi:hypothetical protein BP5796_05940 [Coleophoma crateriformis]|uniref:RING-type domain-containing protein n=1 Tax=Coleophoma crateriformis TaxID=565419 RepID=A0A3D8RVS2_9HELO|nr:hypothetical protein BP5796_05940 [Coleophoma crateriformis]